MKLRINAGWAKWIIRGSSYTLICAGAAGLLWFGYRYVAGLLDERRSELQFAEQLAQAQQQLAERNPTKQHVEGRGPLTQRASEAMAPRRSAPPLARDANLIGKIQIPRVNVSAVVREGVDDDTLGRAVGHVPGTAFPGKEGNVGLAAHRDRYFRGLRNIKIGDEIRVQTTDGVYQYVVESTRIVQPTEVSVLEPTPEPSITLITCYPFSYIGPAPQRFIVRGRRLDGPADVSAKAVPGRLAGASLNSPGM